MFGVFDADVILGADNVFVVLDKSCHLNELFQML